MVCAFSVRVTVKAAEVVLWEREVITFVVEPINRCTVGALRVVEVVRSG